MTQIAFVDTETTGLDADRNQIWEVGVVLVDSESTEVQFAKTWQVRADDIDMGRAEPTALRIGQFYARHVDYGGENTTMSTPADSLALELAVMLDDTILAGNVIDFDSRFLTALLKQHGHVACWHYHLLDVETFAAGVLGLDPPWKGTVVSDKLGVKQPDTAHTAIGDADWSYRLWFAAKQYQRDLTTQSKLYLEHEHEIVGARRNADGSRVDSSWEDAAQRDAIEVATGRPSRHARAEQPEDFGIDAHAEVDKPFEG